jgi:formylglycine-generating enzyme required for sulfatase activity
MGSSADEDGRHKFFSPGIMNWLMGQISNEDSVEVNFRQHFWLAKTEVTQAQWQAVMGSNPSSFKGPNLPVENVYWRDAEYYISEINGKQILPTGWKFALPTEAQWEYACRAGDKGPYSGGSLDEVGWYKDNSGKTHEVGQKKPNAWGLYDMHGNVAEWCADWYDDRLQGGLDPKGPESGKNRVLRGGSWQTIPSACRAADRPCFGVPNLSGDDIGFRTAIVLSN